MVPQKRAICLVITSTNKIVRTAHTQKKLIKNADGYGVTLWLNLVLCPSSYHSFFHTINLQHSILLCSVHSLQYYFD